MSVRCALGFHAWRGNRVEAVFTQGDVVVTTPVYYCARCSKVHDTTRATVVFVAQRLNVQPVVRTIDGKPVGHEITIPV